LRARIDRDKVAVPQEARKELAERRAREPTWSLETHWSHCLLYPLRMPCTWACWPWPGDLHRDLCGFLARQLEPGAAQRLPAVCAAVVLLLAYTVALLQVTLTTATTGQASAHFPARRPGTLARSGVQAIWCFLLGPIVPLIAAYFFWLDSGDLETVDKLILVSWLWWPPVCWTCATWQSTESVLVRTMPVAHRPANRATTASSPGSIVDRFRSPLSSQKK